MPLLQRLIIARFCVRVLPSITWTMLGGWVAWMLLTAQADPAAAAHDPGAMDAVRAFGVLAILFTLLFDYTLLKWAAKSVHCWDALSWEGGIGDIAIIVRESRRLVGKLPGRSGVITGDEVRELGTRRLHVLYPNRWAVLRGFVALCVWGELGPSIGLNCQEYLDLSTPGVRSGLVYVHMGRFNFTNDELTELARILGAATVALCHDDPALTSAR